MKSTPEPDCFRDGAMAAVQGRFEQPDIVPFRDSAVCAQFNIPLQKLFPPMPETSTPEQVRGLLQRIQEIITSPRASKAE
jgi:hypothetical protein